MYLLDVNCLVALFDQSHVNHESAHRWFADSANLAWSSCPITENGLVRVLANPAYPTVDATPVEVIERLDEFKSNTDHSFVSDSVALTDLDESLRKRLSGHQQITDYYLVFLANKIGDRLVTFDGALRRSLQHTTIERSVLLIS